MKNVAVFCKDREQFAEYLSNLYSKGFDDIYWYNCGRIQISGFNYYCMSDVVKADYIKGIRWDAVVHLPEHECRYDLIEQVNMNLRPKPKKTKRQVLIEELEEKLAELKKEEGL